MRAVESHFCNLTVIRVRGMSLHKLAHKMQNFKQQPAEQSASVKVEVYQCFPCTEFIWATHTEQADIFHIFVFIVSLI